jgi:hypothetical protein
MVRKLKSLAIAALFLGVSPQAYAATVKFNTNNSVGITGAGLNCSGDSAAACAEPSGASGNGVIFVSANWRVAFSTDGGSTFKVLDPTTIFPNDAVGFCCDQIIQYAPSIDRFIWLLQGTGYRLAVASPADIKNSNGTAWTYWNLSPNLFGKCTGPDYPDLSIGDNSLYISWDAGGGTGCTAGFQVVRTSLAGIQAGGTITLEFTDPANAPSSKIWGEHLTQNTGDEIFWAGHNGNTKLTVYSLKEGTPISGAMSASRVGQITRLHRQHQTTKIGWQRTSTAPAGIHSRATASLVQPGPGISSGSAGRQALTTSSSRRTSRSLHSIAETISARRNRCRSGTTATPSLTPRFPAMPAPENSGCHSNMAATVISRTM